MATLTKHRDTCRSCNAPFAWARTVKGHRMPVDVEPHPDGNVTITERPDGGYDATVGGDQVDADAPRYRSHFATCKHADKHRRRRPA